MIRRSLAIAPVAAAALAAATCVSAPANGRTLQLDDLRKLVAVSSPAISPDGKLAVVVVTRINWNDDRYDRSLDLIDLTTHARRTLTYERRGLSEPRWSPDGTRLAFIADASTGSTQAAGSGEEAKSQVFAMPMDGGDAQPLTKAPEGVEQFAWRPDGGAIAYAAEDALPKKTGAARFHDAFVVGNTPITTRRPPRPVHLFVIDANGDAKAKQLTFGDRSVATGEAQSTLSWSADGKTIAFLLAPNAVLNDVDRGEIDLLDVATAKITRLTSNAGYEGDPLFSPDGKHIAYARSAGDNQVNLTEAYVTAPGSANGTAISHPFDRAIHGIAWLPDSSGIVFTAHDGTTTAIVRAPLATDKMARIDVGDLVVSSSLEGAIARDGSFVFAASTSKQPSELYYRAAGAAPVKLTDYNAAVAGLDLGATETIAYPTSLGPQGDAVLVMPPGYAAGHKYPLVVFIHGGPTSASLRQFDRQAQLMAARGWLVLEPNYRGSDNLGLAYQRGVLYDPEDGPGKDIMAAVDAVRARGIVDDHRVAVGGWSYGGIMTAWMISKYHLWRAAVSGASVNDWATDYGTADDMDSDRALFHGSPFVGNNAAEYRRASAISYVHDVTTPVLILSDVGDNRDPFATSSMYYRALRDNGKDATFVAWPVDGHFPRDPVRVADVYSRWIDYTAAHLK